jgi:hypothetical protein
MSSGWQMRPLEIVLVVGELVTFLVLGTPRLRAARWLRYSAVIGIPLSAAQALRASGLAA